MIFHRFTFVLCFLGALWITASEVDFLKMCEDSGRGLTFQYRQRTISNGAVTSTDASWKEGNGGYQFVIRKRNEGQPLLSDTDVYTPTHVDSISPGIFPGRVIRRPTTMQLRSFADYYLTPTSNHYAGYSKYTTNLLGEAFQAFERTSQVPETLVAGVSRTPYKEIVLFDSKGLFRQSHKYTSSNTPISSVVLDEFRFETTPLHSISTNGLEIVSVASELEHFKARRGFLAQKLSEKQGVGIKSILLTSMVIFPLSLLAIKWFFAPRKQLN
jgi:hypothetical protein